MGGMSISFVREGLNIELRTKFYVAPMCQWADQPATPEDLRAAGYVPAPESETRYEPEKCAEDGETVEGLRSQIQQLKHTNARLQRALSQPKVWNSEEADGLLRAFTHAHEERGRGMTESLFAVASFILHYRSEVFKLGGYSAPTENHPLTNLVEREGGITQVRESFALPKVPASRHEPIINYTVQRVKPLAELRPSDIPHGMDSDDLATDLED